MAEVKTTCERKKRYETFSHAAKVALKATALRGGMLRTYRCPDCGKWHLTKQVVPRRYENKEVQ